MASLLGPQSNALSDQMSQSRGITGGVHQAIKLLPAAGGSSEVIFQDEARLAQVDGEIQHQSQERWAESMVPVKKDWTAAEITGLTVARPPPPPRFEPPVQNSGLQYSKDQLKEWGYPDYDSKYDDPEWLAQQFQKEKDDPRENRNFFISENSPEFWNNASRKPHMKALMQTDDHWKHRKNTWLEQFSQVRDANKGRDEVCDRLEECTMATKRLVAPIMHCRAVEMHLQQIVKQANERGIPFAQMLETAENQRRLRDFRNTLDFEGESGAERLFNEIHQRNLTENESYQKKRQLEEPKTDSTMKEVKDHLGYACKYRQDGLVEWEKGNHEEALKAWRLGCEALLKIRIPDTHTEEQEFKSEARIRLLKNRAQAALKLSLWNEALECADLALKIDDQDEKAWFRKACALEGLGRVKEMEPCFSMIENIAVGRADRDRIEREIRSKRERLKIIMERDDIKQQRMLQRGLQKSLFSEERDKPVSNAKALEGPPVISHNLAVPNVDESTRKRLTRDGCEDLLKELERAYSEPSFREQVRKLARDVRSQEEFTCYLNKVALPLQRPIVTKWGFEGTDLGVAEMRRAIQDHTLGSEASKELKRQAESTLRALYGEMYDVVRGNGLSAADRAPSSLASAPLEERLKQAEQRLQRRLRSNGDVSDEECKAKPSGSDLTRHWTDRPASKPQQKQVSTPAARPSEAAVVPTAKPVPAANPAADAPPTKPCSAQNRKEIWAELSKAQKSTNKAQLRAALEKAVASGFSEVTMRGAKKALAALGGSLEGL